MFVWGQFMPMDLKCTAENPGMELILWYSILISINMSSFFPSAFQVEKKVSSAAFNLAAQMTDCHLG